MAIAAHVKNSVRRLGNRTALSCAAIVLAVSCLAVRAPAAAPPADGRCIVVDSDAGLDDFRAVAALAATNRIVAIVVTEGLARPVEGAGAMEALLKRAGLSIPVLVGASPNPTRRYRPDARLAEWRSNTERLNGILAAPVAATDQPVNDITLAMRERTVGCDRISVLVIGPWTSFMRYATDILSRIDRIIAQGRPYPDETGGLPSGFNCLYDEDACLAAFDLLVGRQQRAGRRVRADWVDIPTSPESCGSAEPGIDAQGRTLYAFTPVEEWIPELDRAGGMARVVADVLRANPAGWAQTSLWDDLAVLYMIRPALFGVRGGHFEPCVPASTVRHILTDIMGSVGH